MVRVYRMASAFRLGYRRNRGAVLPISAEPNLNGRFIRGSGWHGHTAAMRRLFLIGGLATALCAILPLPAIGQRRRGSRSAGEIITSVSRRFSGKVLGAERAQRSGRAVYRLKVLTKSGNVLSVVADATTGNILSVRGGNR